MPDKQNENKFMAMLERRGIVRKNDSDDELVEPEPVVRSRPEADLRTLFGSPEAETPNITPASRQPVPGMINPIIPTAAPTDNDRVAPRPTERVVSIQRPPRERDELEAEELRQNGSELHQPIRDEEIELPDQIEPENIVPNIVPNEVESPNPIRVVSAEELNTEGFGRPNPNIVSVDPFKNLSPWNEAPTPVPVETAVYERQPEPPVADTLTDRYLDVDDLYDALALKSKKTETIYLVEEYIKTLPDSLPDESRREIVGRIVAASGFDYDLLMGDGVLRVKMLKEYAERFARHTDDYISARQAELDEFDQQILRVRRLIENRRELHKKQFYSIEAEAQRLKEILTFITG